MLSELIALLLTLRRVEQRDRYAANLIQLERRKMLGGVAKSVEMPRSRWRLPD